MHGGAGGRRVLPPRPGTRTGTAWAASAAVEDTVGRPSSCTPAVAGRGGLGGAAAARRAGAAAAARRRGRHPPSEPAAARPAGGSGGDAASAGAPAGRRRAPPPTGFVEAPRPAGAAAGESARTGGAASRPCGPPPASSLRTATKEARAEVGVGGAVGGAVFFFLFCAYNPPPASSPSHLSATSPKEVNDCNKPLASTSPNATPAHRRCGEQVGCPWTQL